MRTLSRPAGPRPSSWRGRRLAGVTVVAVAILVGAAACSSADEPGTATPTTGGSGGGTTATTAAGGAAETGGGGTSTTGVQVAEHGPLPTVDLDDDEQAYVDALVRQPPENMDAEQAGCIAGHWIEAVGVDPVRAAGVTPEGIEAGTASISDIPVDEATAEKVVGAYETCEFDLVDLVVTGFTGMVQGDPTKVACLQGVVTPEVARTYMVAAIMAGGSGASAMADIQALVQPCLT